MYNFKQDTKSTRSMLAIRDALVRCMRTKRFHDITITDLSKESHVSRVTFYRFFATTTDVLEYLCDSVFEEAATDFRFVDMDKHDEYVRFLLDYLMKRFDILDTIYRSRRIDLFQKSFSRYADHYLPHISKSFSKDDADYVKAAVAAAFASIIFVWAEHGKKESPEYLMRIFRLSTGGISTRK